MKYLICYDISDDKCRRVVAGQHTQISTEAMYLLLQNNCQITYIDRRGKIMAYLGDGHQSLDKSNLIAELFLKLSNICPVLYKFVPKSR